MRRGRMMIISKMMRMGLCEHPVWSRLSANQSRNICLLSWLVRRAVINGRGVVSASWVWSSESTLCRLSLLPSPLIEVANSSCSSCLARCRILTAPPGKPCLSHKSLLTLPQISPLPSCPVCTLTPCLEPGLALADVAWIVPLLCASSQKYIPPRLPTWHKESWRLEQQRYKWSNKMDIYLQWIVAILIVLVDLDVHK